MGISKLTKSCQETGRIYAEALVEACTTATPPRGKRPADPIKVITDTDEYPWVVKAIDQAEFLVGWFHGVAEAMGVLPEVIWEAFVPAVKAKSARKPRKAAAANAPAPKAPKPRAAKAAPFDLAPETGCPVGIADCEGGPTCHGECEPRVTAPARKRSRKAATAQLELG